MATKTKAGAAGQAAALPIDADKAHTALVEVESLARTTFGEIAALARMALVYLETPHAYRNPENVAQVLEVICDRANVAADCVSHEAEQLGVSVSNSSWHRRLAAQELARQEHGG